MYTVTIPVMIRETFDIQCTLDELKRAGADRVLLALRRPLKTMPDGERKLDTMEYMDLLAEIIPQYKEAGLEVGVWLGETMGHGLGTGRSDAVYTPFTSITGKESKDGFCCADSRFISDVSEWAANAAKAGAELVLLDDDWRMTAHGDNIYAGCMCSEHIKRFNALVGEELTREEIVKRVFTGGGSIYRAAWRTLMGGDMLWLAAQIRAAVDAVNPECRIGLCTAPTVVDLDGADYMEIAETLAGQTQPYVRLIGAPYWAHSGSELSAVILGERMEAHFADEWAEETGAEIVLEGDVYPRPRFRCPAAYLECADLACRADMAFTGSQKYMIDYLSTPRYEHGYIDAHVRNAEFAESVERMFDDKIQTGIMAVEYQHLFAGYELGSEPYPGNLEAYELFRGTSLRALANMSAPVSFETGVPAVFGENAKYVSPDVIESGAILDASAAAILNRRGFDTGVAVGGDITASAEHIIKENEDVQLTGCTLKKLIPADGAEVLTTVGGYPGVVRYENSRGGRFAVYAEAVRPFEGSSFFRSYSRQRELYDIAEWIGRKKLPARITGNPDLYIMEAQSEDLSEFSVLLLNLSPDAIEEPELTLAFEPDTVEYAGCTGTVYENVLTLSRIEPFGHAAFTFRKAPDSLEKTVKSDELKVKVYENRDEAGRAAAREIAGELRRLLEYKEWVNMIFAAAPSQNETLKYLAAEDGIEWERVRAFHMDEYTGLKPGSEQSFVNYLDTHIFDAVPFGEIYSIDGSNPGECERYSALLKKYPVDITVLGIGENGHIAFNDPGVADFDDGKLMKIVPLDDVCRMQQVHDGCFAKIDDVPTHALTLTIPALTRAGAMFCTVPAATKAEAVKKTVYDDISESCPATIMRTHPHAVMFCDRASGTGI